MIPGNQRQRLRAGKLLAFLGVVAVLASCPMPLLHHGCKDDSACAPGHVCAAGTCVKPLAPPVCLSNADCGAGQACAAGKCVSAIALPECQRDADCGVGSTCKAGHCSLSPECSSDADCPKGASCNAEQRCVRPSQERGVFWNVWAERGRPLQDIPLKVVAPKSRFTLVVDLATLAFAQAGSVEVRPSLGARLDEWAKSAEQDDFVLEVLAIPDGRFVKGIPGVPKAAKLRIPVAVLRAAKAGTLAAPAAGDGGLKEAVSRHGLGKVAFDLQAGALSGKGVVSLSIWDAWGRPVDGLEAHVRVGPGDGSAVELVRGGVPGIDSLRIAAGDARGPDASLLVLGIGDSQATGVFRTREMPLESSLVWPLEHTAQDLRQQLSHSLFADLASASESRLKTVGRALATALFPPDAPEAQQARRALEAFLAKVPGAAPGTPASAVPSLFVRVLQDDIDGPFMLPLGLLFVGSDADGGFLGFKVRVETPLDYQSYGASTACVAEWTMVAPTEDDGGALGEAWKAWAPGPGRFGLVPQWQADYGATLASFATLMTSGPAPSDPMMAVIVSHHADDRLYWGASMQVTALGISTEVPPGSAAVLSACSTSGTGALGLLRKLNQRGFSALVGTASNVKGHFAGTFVDCWAQESSLSPPRMLGDVYWRSLQCLRQRKSEGETKYGARALLFVLAGDGGIRICPPAKTATPGGSK